MENNCVYIGVYKNNALLVVLKFNNVDDITTDYIDGFHDKGYVLKPITEKEYDGFDEGDELSMKDLKKGNYKVINS